MRLLWTKFLQVIEFPLAICQLQHFYCSKEMLAKKPNFFVVAAISFNNTYKIWHLKKFRKPLMKNMIEPKQTNKKEKLYLSLLLQ